MTTADGRFNESEEEQVTRFTTRRKVPQWLGHVAATAAVTFAGVFQSLPVRDVTWSPEILALNLVAAGVLLGRRRWPTVVLSVVVALVVVSVPLGLFNAGTVVAVAIAMYTLSLRGMPHPRGIVVELLVAATMLAASLTAGTAVPQHVLVVLFGGVLGDAIRAQREHVLSLTERAERAERARDALARQRVAEERLAIARDLHDVVAHQIAVINLHAGVASSALQTRPEDAAASLMIVRSSARTVLRQIGDLMTTLRDPDAVDNDPPGLADLAEIVNAMAAHGLDMTIRKVGEPYELAAAVDSAALRVIQEALTNAHKHGIKHRAHVLIEYRPHAVQITVTNPVPNEHQRTPGDEPEPDVLGTGNGLLGLRERIEPVHGTLQAGPDGIGAWVLVAELPTTPHAVADDPHPTTPERNT